MPSHDSFFAMYDADPGEFSDMLAAARDLFPVDIVRDDPVVPAADEPEEAPGHLIEEASPVDGWYGIEDIEIVDVDAENVESSREGWLAVRDAAEPLDGQLYDEEIEAAIFCVGEFDQPEVVREGIRAIVEDIAASVTAFANRGEGFVMDVDEGVVQRTLLDDLQGCVLRMLSEGSLARFGHVDRAQVREYAPEEALRAVGGRTR